VTRSRGPAFEAAEDEGLVLHWSKPTIPGPWIWPSLPCTDKDLGVSFAGLENELFYRLTDEGLAAKKVPIPFAPKVRP
jgi:hypothetical protein